MFFFITLFPQSRSGGGAGHVVDVVSVRHSYPVTQPFASVFFSSLTGASCGHAGSGGGVGHVVDVDALHSYPVMHFLSSYFVSRYFPCSHAGGVGAVGQVVVPFVGCVTASCPEQLGSHSLHCFAALSHVFVQVALNPSGHVFSLEPHCAVSQNVLSCPLHDGVHWEQLPVAESQEFEHFAA